MNRAESDSGGSQVSVAREFFAEQLPLIVLTFAAGLAAAYLQHGTLPGGDIEFPTDGVRVPIWHLMWMGAWTGYTLALVGEASGIFALPYTMSVLQFSSPAVFPTTQILTLFNPLGALFGFRRNRQWNLDFALWACIGGASGAPIGPFIRLIPMAMSADSLLDFSSRHGSDSRLSKEISDASQSDPAI